MPQAPSAVEVRQSAPLSSAAVAVAVAVTPNFPSAEDSEDPSAVPSAASKSPANPLKKMVRKQQ